MHAYMICKNIPIDASRDKWSMQLQLWTFEGKLTAFDARSAMLAIRQISKHLTNIRYPHCLGRKLSAFSAADSELWLWYVTLYACLFFLSFLYIHINMSIFYIYLLLLFHLFIYILIYLKWISDRAFSINPHIFSSTISIFTYHCLCYTSLSILI